MGEYKEIVCHDCEEYAKLDKLEPYDTITGDEIDGEWFNDDYNQQWSKNLIEFALNHQGCHITVLGEYGGTQERVWGHDYDNVGE